ncbi:hypothetical protein HYFRA_00011549 [Hymenoscyphus fraxineus]|uniref:Uncharacterized protein n=1 Tax=Hymenoscyphus fraxineus TaxID=746836 RepID=A0A9N9L830_9HELO|nr:hypothetical protein HYFRA_00011549 [Hymenoscyphus fraxineus]
MASYNPFSGLVAPVVASRFNPDQGADEFTKLRCALLNHLFSSKMVTDNPFYHHDINIRHQAAPIMREDDIVYTYDLDIDDRYFQYYGLGNLQNAPNALLLVGKLQIWGRHETFRNRTKFCWNVEISAELRDAEDTTIRIPRSPPYTRGLVTQIMLHGTRDPLVEGDAVGWRDVVKLLRTMTARIYGSNGEGEDDWQMCLDEQDDFFGKVHSFLGNHTRKFS